MEGKMTLSHRFTGKVALVTDGNSRIGLATTLAFAEEGARVVLQDSGDLGQGGRQLGENVVAVRNDTGNVANGIKLAALLQQKCVMLDAMFINAGVAKLAPFETGDVGYVFQHQREGAVFFDQGIALSAWNPGAAIVLNDSINAHIGMSQL